MSQRAARTRLAKAIRTHGERQLAITQKVTHYATVRGLDPFQVELQDRRLILDEDDLVITQWVRRYGYDYGLQVGDTVLVHHMPNDDFVVADVVSTDDIPEGFGASDTTTVSLTSRNGHILRSVPFYGADGTIIGRIPVYTALTGDGAPV